jgi:hypothetical protein
MGKVQNNTFYGNLTSGSGNGYPSTEYSSIMSVGELRNNIIWQTSLDPALAARTLYCCISDWTSGGVKNITADPQLVNPIGGDFHLRATSPCIDAGSRTSATRDFDGEARGYKGTTATRGDGSRFDIGADEYLPAAAAR